MALSYVMSAEESLSADIIAIVNAEIAAGPPSTSGIELSQYYLGISYDRENKTLLYSMCYFTPASGTNTNTTGVPLWSGLHTINAGATYDATLARNFSIMTRPLTGSTVTRYDCWSATSTVPNGIGPSTGTALRFVEADFTTPQVIKVVDPRTRNVLSHHTTTLGLRSCMIYEFRYSDSYKQTISPYIPSADRHLEIGGISNDWYLIGDQGKAGGSGYSWQFLPRLRQADEVAADYLLSYGEVVETAPLDAMDKRWAFSSDGIMWLFGRTVTGAYNYVLYKITMPTSGVVNPCTGQTISAVTPWGAADGPNTNAALYSGATGSVNAFYLHYQPVADMLVAISKKYPCDTIAAPHNDPVNFSMDVSYLPLPGLTVETHTGFVTGYMDANWASTNLAGAAYAVVDVWEADQADLAFHSYTFTNANYIERWFAFAVIPVIAGVIQGTYPTTTPPISDAITSSTHIVLVRYSFVQGSAPTIIDFIAGTPAVDENGWDTAYSTYGTAIGNTNVVRQSFVPSSTISSSYYDMGVWDEATSSWWWSGQNGNFWKLDSAFTPRNSPTAYMDNPPILKLTLTSAAASRRQTMVRLVTKNGHSTPSG